MVRHTLELFDYFDEDNQLAGIRAIINEKGHQTIIDEEDLHLIQDKRWRAKKKGGYIVRGERVKQKYRLLYLHREILLYHGWHIPEGHHIDHINHRTNDNRKANLRVATKSENQANRRRRKADGYKGVTRNKRTGAWEARVQFEGKYIFLGSYSNPRIAAHFYNEAAKQIHGEFAQLNLL